MALKAKAQLSPDQSITPVFCTCSTAYRFYAITSIILASLPELEAMKRPLGLGE